VQPPQAGTHEHGREQRPGTPAAGQPAAPAATPSTTPPGQPPGNRAATQPGAAAPASKLPPPTVAAPLPPPPAVTEKALPADAAQKGPHRLEDFRGQRHEEQRDGRTIITEPGRVIVKDPSGRAFIRHNEEDRFRYGARDVRTRREGDRTQTVVVRPDGSQIITITDRDGRLWRRIRRDRDGREIIIIDNSFGDRDYRRGNDAGAVAAGVAAGLVAGAIGGYYVSLPPPVVTIPRDRYIVEAEDAPPDVIYETLMAPPVERLDRRYTLEEIRYSPSVRERMPSIDLDTINFDTGSWAISEDQAAKLQVIADGINRAISRNPKEVFLIEGHTDAVGSDVDNLSLSDRRAQSVAELLTQQFQVPPENLVTQGYGEQDLKVQTAGPSRENRRVTVRRITPLLDGGVASMPPPPRR
jgi:outer membrane protein OmpA-like peptidoglycan-associated protein